MNATEGLSRLLQRIVQAPSAFCRQRLVAAGWDVSSLEPELLARLPLTRRAQLLRDQLEHPPHGTRRCMDAAPPVRAGITSSGAELLVLSWTAADLARERRAGARLLTRLGIRSGMAVANTLRGALATPGALLLGDVLEEIGALDVPLGAIENDAVARQAWQLVDRVQPTVMIVDHAAAARFFAAMPAAERPWWRGIVWLNAGAVEAPQSTVPAVARFTGWQRLWLAVPEATSFVAYACAAGRLHCDEGVVAEVVDGELVLTPLAVDAPVLRYVTGVRARALDTPCACGSDAAGLELP
jgi:phenylacetate-coenzyme A ligase PaaK-like adenylate-forming protein